MCLIKRSGLPSNWRAVPRNPPTPPRGPPGTESIFAATQPIVATDVGGNPETVMVKAEEKALRVCFADCTFRVPLAGQPGNLRPWIEQYLWALAAEELEVRAIQLAAEHQLELRQVAIRNQRTRWGSCSSIGTISLNWRLVQTPPRVSDYIILHELMHLHEMNHSTRFWRKVAKVCPDYREAEHWLRRHAGLLT